MQSNIEQLRRYFESQEELEYSFRMNYEWNDESFQTLKAILLDLCDEDKQSDLYRHYKRSEGRIAGTMRNPLSARTRPEEYKAYVEEKVDIVETLRHTLYP